MTFSNWCREMWYEHIDEMISLTGKAPVYTAKEYFNKYRWWLRREYRFQHSDEHN